MALAELVDARRCAEVARISLQAHGALATGAGRVFEAAGALLARCPRNHFGGQAAVALEALAAQHEGDAEVWSEVSLPADRPELPTAALLTSAARRLVGGEPATAVAAGFHATFAHLAAELTARVVPQDGTPVAIGGGCLVNRFLRRWLSEGLAARGYEALLPEELPAGDRALSYGQAVLAAAALARGKDLQGLEVRGCASRSR